VFQTGETGSTAFTQHLNTEKVLWQKAPHIFSNVAKWTRDEKTSLESHRSFLSTLCFTTFGFMRHHMELSKMTVKLVWFVLYEPLVTNIASAIVGSSPSKARTMFLWRPCLEHNESMVRKHLGKSYAWYFLVTTMGLDEKIAERIMLTPKDLTSPWDEKNRVARIYDSMAPRGLSWLALLQWSCSIEAAIRFQKRYPTAFFDYVYSYSNLADGAKDIFLKIMSDLDVKPTSDECQALELLQSDLRKSLDTLLATTWYGDWEEKLVKYAMRHHPTSLRENILNFQFPNKDTPSVLSNASLFGRNS
jgi:hypothetical protein